MLFTQKSFYIRGLILCRYIKIHDSEYVRNSTKFSKHREDSGGYVRYLSDVKSSCSWREMMAKHESLNEEWASEEKKRKSKRPRRREKCQLINRWAVGAPGLRMTGHGIGGGEMISSAGRGPCGDKSVSLCQVEAREFDYAKLGAVSKFPVVSSFCLVARSEIKEIDQTLTNFATVERTVDVQGRSLTYFA